MLCVLFLVEIYTHLRFFVSNPTATKKKPNSEMKITQKPLEMFVGIS